MATQTVKTPEDPKGLKDTSTPLKETKVDVRAADDFTPVAPREEHLNEIAFQMDEPILDPTHELAVQVTEGVGADGTEVQIPLANALKAGSPEALFASGKAEETTGRDKADLA